MSTPDMEAFETDTGKLWLAGSRLLPSVAENYANLSTQLLCAQQAATDTFSTANSVTGGLQSIHSTWDSLRSDFQDLLAAAATSLADAGTSMEQLATDRARTDADAAGEIAAAQRQLGTPEPLDDVSEQPPISTRSDSQRA